MNQAPRPPRNRLALLAFERQQRQLAEEANRNPSSRELICPQTDTTDGTDSTTDPSNGLENGQNTATASAGQSNPPTSQQTANPDSSQERGDANSPENADEDDSPNNQQQGEREDNIDDGDPDVAEGAGTDAS